MSRATVLRRLRAANPTLTIREVTSRAFERYGRVLRGMRADAAVGYARRNARVADEVVYEPSVTGLERDKAFRRAVEHRVYGGMPVQIGWCYGRNSRLDALEYHKGVEVVVAVTDTVVIVGDLRDLRWTHTGPTYRSAQAEVFYLPRGLTVEFHAWCLHFAPIHVCTRQGFVTLVVLPQGTNTDVVRPARARGEERLLFARNKWLVAHREAAPLVEQGAVVGITGRNTRVAPVD